MKKNPITRALAVVLTLLMVCTTVLSVPTTVDAAAKAKKITLTSTKKTLYVGKSFTLKVKKVTPSNASKKVTFTSSNKNIATVNAKGKVKAKNPGKATITVTSKTNKKAKATCKVTVKKGVKEIQTATKLVMQKGKSVTLHYGITPNTAANKKMKFSSSNKKVATVSKKGKIKAKKVGSAKIIVKSADGCAKATVKISVKKKIKAVSKIDLNKTTLALNKGTSDTLTTVVTPANATSKKVYWVSSNTDVATVKNGVVTAVGNGTVNITAYATDSSGKKATCVVTVSTPAGSTTDPTKPVDPNKPVDPDNNKPEDPDDNKPENPDDNKPENPDDNKPENPDDNKPEDPNPDDEIDIKDGKTTIRIKAGVDQVVTCEYNGKKVQRTIKADQIQKAYDKYQEFVEATTIPEVWSKITTDNFAAYADLVGAEVVVTTEGNVKKVTVTRDDQTATSVLTLDGNNITVEAKCDSDKLVDGTKTVVISDIDMNKKSATINAGKYDVTVSWTGVTATVFNNEIVASVNYAEGEYVVEIDNAFASEVYSKALTETTVKNLPATYEEAIKCITLEEAK